MVDRTSCGAAWCCQYCSLFPWEINFFLEEKTKRLSSACSHSQTENILFKRKLSRLSRTFKGCTKNVRKDMFIKQSIIILYYQCFKDKTDFFSLKRLTSQQPVIFSCTWWRLAPISQCWVTLHPLGGAQVQTWWNTAPKWSVYEWKSSERQTSLKPPYAFCS